MKKTFEEQVKSDNLKEQVKVVLRELQRPEGEPVSELAGVVLVQDQLQNSLDEKGEQFLSYAVGLLVLPTTREKLREVISEFLNRSGDPLE